MTTRLIEITSRTPPQSVLRHDDRPDNGRACGRVMVELALTIELPIDSGDTMPATGSIAIRARWI